MKLPYVNPQAQSEDSIRLKDIPRSHKASYCLSQFSTSHRVPASWPGRCDLIETLSDSYKWEDNANVVCCFCVGVGANAGIIYCEIYISLYK